ncbi:MAG: DUF305 domain-containing protein [Actinomycetota bacterium]|nr:DUF305 domain-containing protein [Actinomycetota bacterium]
MKRLATVLALVALALTACTTKKELKKHNEADVSFVQAMIPHHEQAIHMVELALEHGNSPDVRKLATTIKIKQEEELKTMEHLLHEWHMKKEEHGGHGPEHPGMLSEEKLKELEETEGVEFDKLFLELMIEHHEGAIHLAEEAEHKGENEEVEKLAAEIKRGQEHEIEKMEMELVGL